MQILQICGFSFVWMKRCVLRLLFLVNVALHSRQVCGLSFVWVRRLSSRVLLWANVLSPMSPTSCFSLVWGCDIWGCTSMRMFKSTSQTCSFIPLWMSVAHTVLGNNSAYFQQENTIVSFSWSLLLLIYIKKILKLLINLWYRAQKYFTYFKKSKMWLVLF